jgi:hypothetical protein
MQSEQTPERIDLEAKKVTKVPFFPPASTNPAESVQASAGALSPHTPLGLPRNSILEL